jgi:hypothetical protein
MVQHSRQWKEASDVIPMFPSFAWKTQLEPGLRDALRETILAAITGMRAEHAPLPRGEGWKSRRGCVHPRSFERHS